MDGNKRTAAVLCETFLLLNGASLRADDPDLYPLYLALAEGALSEDYFAAWLRRNITVDENERVHEEPAPCAR